MSTQHNQNNDFGNPDNGLYPKIHGGECSYLLISYIRESSTKISAIAEQLKILSDNNKGLSDKVNFLEKENIRYRNILENVYKEVEHLKNMEIKARLVRFETNLVDVNDTINKVNKEFEDFEERINDPVSTFFNYVFENNKFLAWICKLILYGIIIWSAGIVADIYHVPAIVKAFITSVTGSQHH